MTLALNWKGQVYDNAVPFYVTTIDEWVFNRVACQWMTAQSLADEMAADSYVPAETEVGIPPVSWMQNHEPHEFAKDLAAGRDWGWNTAFPDPTP